MGTLDVQGGESAAGSLAEAEEGCQVLGDFFGFVVQGLLFAVVMGTLLLKWWAERPRRRFLVFMLDSSKQISGAGAVHCMNMLCAMTFAHGQKQVADECAWYWVNIMLDTTLGVLICYGLLKATEALFGYSSGHYGKGADTGIDWEENPDYTTWAWQIVVWCLIVAVMKLAVVVAMFVWQPFWEQVSTLATHWIKDREMRLVFVMIVTPTFMNMFQFIVTDSFIKHKMETKEDVSV